ncbi:MAG TPA: hypothetical protein VGO66_02295 [Solirubrobacterales bacterium]|jgi:hypothetical protein|nr:hypothetical protein [Solirubrobacterales bacterium]
MLDLGRYLLGVAYLVALAGFVTLWGVQVRRWLLPRLSGAPALLGTAVLALSLLLWTAEILGSFELFGAAWYLAAVALAGVAAWRLLPRVAPGWGDLRRPQAAEPKVYPGERLEPGRRSSAKGKDGTPPGRQDPRAGAPVPTLIALAIAAAATIHFAAGVRLRLSTGITGFDSTWYHGPFAARFFQSGDTWGLHFIAPQFLAWFYPANSEVFHAAGMLAFGRDVLSPLLNLGWFVGCLFACWCIGRPYRVAPWSLVLGAVALSIPALSDQAGEARNDIVGIFFLLAAVAIALNAWAAREEGERSLSAGALVVTGLAAGLAAGTKLNFLLPCAVLVLGLVAIAPRGLRGRALLATGLAALAGGGYWYLRNLVHAGNPLPWVHHLGPISLPSPGQGLGGREAHSVFGYLTDGSVLSDWFLPGLHSGLWLAWPLLCIAALAGLVLSLQGLRSASFPLSGTKEDRSDGADLVLPLAGLVGLATALAWIVAPTSASGPDGMPRGFESGLRYLAPALVLGLALLPTAPLLRTRLAQVGLRSSLVPPDDPNDERRPWLKRSAVWIGSAAALMLLAIAIGYPVQRHYLQGRYADPSFTTPGLNAAFAWSRDISNAHIATTSTRQYPLFGIDLSNRVQFIGQERPSGGFEAPTTCRTWREELNKGEYDYVVATRDRVEPGKPPYPPQASWTEGPEAKIILRKPPTVVFELKDPLDPLGCP